MISSIKIPLKEYTSIIDEKSKDNIIPHLSKDCINNLSKVNIFVGANNSGKSRFMRTLVQPTIQFQTKKTEKIIKELDNLKKEFNHWLGYKKQELNKDEQLNIFTQTKDFSFITNSKTLISFYENLKSKIKKIIHSEAYIKRRYRLNEKDMALYLNNYFLKHNFDDLFKSLGDKKYKCVYIPMLRGLRPISYPENDKDKIKFDNTDTYSIRTKMDYYKKNHTQILKTDFDVFTGLSLYDEIKKMLLGKKEKRDQVRNFEKFLEKYFFNKPIELIPNIDSDVLHIQIGDEKERPIYDVGDGLQTIIIATFPLFKYKKENLLLFIEEPEIALHPGLQRKLLNTYCKYSKNAQIFITTHSNHLLDLTLDYNGETSIYSFEKNEKQILKIVNFEEEKQIPFLLKINTKKYTLKKDDDETFKIKYITPNKEILDKLGVRNSSVFLSNCIIWVEGITDRLYIKKYLELYFTENPTIQYEEDKHYSILEYGGGNITHFNFDENNTDDGTINTDPINKNNFLIADHDDYEQYENPIKEKDDMKLKRLKSFHKLLGTNFFAKHREIENLIPFKIYQKYFENLNESSNHKWIYDANKLKGSTLTETTFNDEINNTAIGTHLKKYFITLKDDADKSYQFNKNDISCIGGDKKKIAKELIEIIDPPKDKNNPKQSITHETLKFNELPEITQELIKEIIRFIKDNNTD